MSTPRHITLITGATAGIGKASAFACAKAGYDLILTGRRSDRLAEVANEIMMRMVNIVMAVAPYAVSAEFQSSRHR